MGRFSLLTQPKEKWPGGGLAWRAKASDFRASQTQGPSSPVLSSCIEKVVPEVNEGLPEDCGQSAGSGPWLESLLAGADPQKLKEVGALLKAYQREVDALTKRAKAAEGTFLELYKGLREVQLTQLEGRALTNDSLVFVPLNCFGTSMAFFWIFNCTQFYIFTLIKLHSKS